MTMQLLAMCILVMSSMRCAPQDSDAPPQQARPGAATQDGGGDCPVDENMRPMPADVDPVIDALLRELEAAHQGVHAFGAKVTYEKIEDLLGRREVQTGELLVTRNVETEDMRFAVLFDAHLVGRIGSNLRREERLNHYIFDGRWLAEIDHQRKQFIKRELVPPGEKLNPLKLGEGPIPLPVGQARDDVVRRFQVVQATLPEDGPLNQLDPGGIDGLRLTPRDGTPESEDYAHIDIFYDKNTRLPVGIRAVMITEDVKTVLLRDAVSNPEWGDQELAKLDIQDPDPSEWDISVVFWRGE